MPDNTNARTVNVCIKYSLVFILLAGISGLLHAQENDFPDTTRQAGQDTVNKKEDNFLTAKVSYDAADSIVFSNKSNKVFLYNEGFVKYGKTELKAGYIRYDFSTNEAIAYGIKDDSTNTIVQKPQFKDRKETFTADTIRYNFKTEEGLIYGVVTEQSEGYLHSELTKKQSSGEIHVSKGKYTTCDLDHPHYYIHLKKAIVVPNEKIISGPLYFVIHDVPLFPVRLPFGMFPITQKHASGFIMPQYGEENRRGFFLRDGGFYFALNDYMDLAITGDVYSKGTWGLNVASKYNVRYKFNGNFNVRYRNDVSSEKGLPDYSRNQSFSIRWTHSQDPKANPYSTFSANVDFQTNGFNQKHSESLGEYLKSQKSSSLSYRRNWPELPFNLTANMSADQNTSTNNVSLRLPDVSFSVNRLYPFKKGGTGGKWYQKFQMSYSASFKNTLSATDSTIFERGTLDKFQYGFEHSIPLSIPIKLANNLTLSPNANYKGVFTPRYQTKRWVDEEIVTRRRMVNGEEIIVQDTLRETVVNDTINEFMYAQQFSPSISLSYSPRIYGMFQFKPEFIKKRVQAIRHVMNPSVSVNYRPPSLLDDSKFYREHTSGYTLNEDKDTTWNTQEYSVFRGVSTYAAPSSSRKSGNISFGLGNNLEMKVRSAKDTTSEYKKVKILENLNVNTGYNMFADSMHWSNISFGGSTRLMDKISFRFNGSFDPYAVDSSGNSVDTYEWEKNNRLARFTGANFSANMDWNAGGKSGEGKRDIKKTENPFYPYGRYRYVDFTMPWKISISYNLYYEKNRFNIERQEFDANVRQTMQFNGNVTLTDKWKFNFSSGYDFESNSLTPTSINIYRDLHCWEMSFEWVPFGPRKSFYFQINIKSSVLRDVKYEKNERFY